MQITSGFSTRNENTARQSINPTKTTLSEECRTHNKRFGATAAERADLKGSAGMPPLRQAAIPLGI